MFDSNPDLLRRVTKVYVAGASAEIERARTMISLLEAAGIHVTSTWPSIIDSVGDANPRDASRDDRRRLSSICLEQVREADLLWFLVPPKDRPSSGAWVETGCAIDRGKLVIASGDTKQSIFPSLAIELDDDHAALALIRKLADSQDEVVEQVKRDAERWRITARTLAERLRNLRGIDDPELQAILG